MEIRYITKAIHALAPNSEWSFNDDDLTTLNWLSDSTQPTAANILKEAEKQKQLEATEAQAKATARASALAKLAALGLTADEIAAL